MGLFWKKDRSVIRVRMFDAETGEQFAQSDMQIQQLPESFESQTKLHLPSGDWEVVEARPMTVGEFRKSGELVLMLRQIRTVNLDPKDVLFGIPTICDSTPPIERGSTKLGKQVIELHEDDWRQVEWIHASHSDVIDEELHAIRMIYEIHRVGIGFRKIHLRKAIPEPLAGHGVQLEALASALASTGVWLDGVAYEKIAGVVSDSFAMRLICSLEIYGIAPRGAISAMCLQRPRINNKPDPDVGILASFAVEHRLVLVDWCRALRIEADAGAYREYFTPRNVR